MKSIEAGKCFVLPDGVDLRLGALVEPMAVAWRGVELSGSGKLTPRWWWGAVRSA